MGKGDKKSKKGKRFRGSFGVSRPKKSSVTNPNAAKPEEAKKEEKPAEEAKA